MRPIEVFNLILDNNLATANEIVEEIGCSSEEIEAYSFLEPKTLAPKIFFKYHSAKRPISFKVQIKSQAEICEL